MRKLLLFAVAILVFLAGCISITYYHKVNGDGTSTLEQQLDLTGYINAMKGVGTGAGGGQSDPSAQLALLCASVQPKLKEGTECKVENNVWTLRKAFKTEDGFYTFESKDNKQILTVNKLPADLFMKPGEDSGGGFGGGLGTGAAQDLDFNDKVKNKQSADQMTQNPAFQINMTYVIEMPGPVTKAVYGSHEAKKEGNKAVFNLVEVLADSAPLVVESEAGSNMLLIIGAVVAVVIVLALLWFFLSRKPAQPVAPPPVQ